MSTPTLEQAPPETRTKEILISADSHVMEPHDFWTKALPDTYSEPVPSFPPPKLGEGFQGHPGGHDPHERIKEMAADGVSGEVLYPTLGLSIFSLDDAKLQEDSFRLYNDWLIEYCSVDTNRLVGVPCISIYDVNHAVKELERCRKAGLQGALIWQAPHPDLPFYSDHYDGFWAACQDLDAALSLHILTGHGYVKNRRPKDTHSYRESVNLKLLEAANALFDFTFFGILKKYPSLKLVSVENEIGWIPFVVQQWDYYYRRFRKENPPPIDEDPSVYLGRQFYATFFNDAVGGHQLEWVNVDNYMWSNDFPHPNSTWPNSRKVVERDLGRLPADKRKKLVCDNVAQLYSLTVPEPVE